MSSLQDEFVVLSFVERPFPVESKLSSFSNHNGNNEALFIRLKSDDIDGYNDPPDLLVPRILNHNSAAFNIFMVFDKYTFQEALQERIITGEEITKATKNNPIIHGESSGKVICSGSAFLLNPWFDRPQEPQTVFFATARHNLCKQIMNDHVIKLSALYLTESLRKCDLNQDIMLKDIKKHLATPLIIKDIENLMSESDPDITFFKIDLDGFTSYARSFGFFKESKYFIPKSMPQLPIITDDNYNVGIVCVMGKWRDIDFERLKNINTNIDSESLRQHLERFNMDVGSIVWSFGQSTGFKTIGNIDYIGYNCASAPGCSGGACVIMKPTNIPMVLEQKSFSFIGVHRGFSPQHDCNIATPFSLVKGLYKTLIYDNIKSDLPRKERKQIEEFLDVNESCCTLL